MINGLWAVTFQTPTDSGSGVVTIRDGRVTGGDSAFTYIGSLSDNGNGGTAGEIHVKRYSQMQSGLIPGLDSYTLDVSGTASGGQFNLSGALRGNPKATLTISGKKVADA